MVVVDYSSSNAWNRLLLVPILLQTSTIGKMTMIYKRPMWRLGLMMYVLLVHVMWLLF